MLSLLSDEYRGKTQGLRIGALSSDIKEMKSEIIEPPTNGTNTLTIRDQTQRDFIVLNGAQDEVDFKFGAKFTQGLYAGTIYPLVGGGEINSLATYINERNTYEFLKHTGLQNFTVPSTTFAAAPPFPASFAPPSETHSNFTLPFNSSTVGWSQAISFSTPSVYQVTASFVADNSNHPVIVALCTVDPGSGNKIDLVTRAEIDNGTAKFASFSGVLNLTGTHSVIGLVFYSPGGNTTLNNFDFNITFRRLN